MPESVVEAPHGVWATLREAVHGTQVDYTTAPIGRAVILLAVPMVLEMAMESIFAVADVFWVAHLGADAVATVGLTESMMTIIYTAAMGLSIGATALVSRRIGEQNPEGAAHAAGQSILLGLGASAAIALLAAPNAPALLRLMGASDTVIRSGGAFTRIMLGGNATVLLLFLLNAVFRGAGDAAIAMRVLVLGNVLNIVLGPCFIFGLGPFPALGVRARRRRPTSGAAPPSLSALFAHARRPREGRPAASPPGRRGDVERDPPVGPGHRQIMIGTASYVGLVRILSDFGSAARGLHDRHAADHLRVAAPWGLSNAAATMVGQKPGARRPDRAEQAVWSAAVYNMVFWDDQRRVSRRRAVHHGALHDRPQVQPYAIGCLRIVSLGFVFYAYGMVLTSAFNGAGDTWTPTWINLFVFWLFEIPLAWWLAHRGGFGARGVFIALTAAYSSLAVVSAVLFRRGAWKTRKV